MRIRSWRVYLLALVVAMTVFLAACGSGGAKSKTSSGTEMPGMGIGGSSTSAGAASRTVDVNMVDIAYEPKEFTVKKGETVRFMFKNTGKIAHEALFGDAAIQDEHERTASSMGAAADMSNMNEVQPGQTKTVTYTFDKQGTIIIGCHEPGHYAAGMKVNVTVE